MSQADWWQNDPIADQDDWWKADPVAGPTEHDRSPEAEVPDYLRSTVEGREAVRSGQLAEPFGAGFRQGGRMARGGFEVSGSALSGGDLAATIAGVNAGAIQPSEGLRTLQQEIAAASEKAGGGFRGFGAALATGAAGFVQDPASAAEFTGQALGTSLPMAAGTLAGAAAGSVVPGVGSVLGGLAGGATTTATMEFGLWMQQAVSERVAAAGGNPADPEAIRTALADPGVQSELFAEAARKGVAQAVLQVAIDRATLGLTRGLRGRPVAQGVTGTTLQAVGEAAEEAGAQYAATGEVDEADVAMEALGGPMAGAVQTAALQAIDPQQQGVQPFVRRRADNLSPSDRASQAGAAGIPAGAVRLEPVVGEDEPQRPTGFGAVLQGATYTGTARFGEELRARVGESSVIDLGGSPIVVTGEDMARLTPSDIDSPMPNDVIAAGKKILASIPENLGAPPARFADQGGLMPAPPTLGYDRSIVDRGLDARALVDQDTDAYTRARDAREDALYDLEDDPSTNRVRANLPPMPALPGSDRATGSFLTDYPAGEPVQRAIEEAATAVEPAPTEAQKEAGNYRKGHVRFAGLDVTIETPRGGERSGVGPDGTPWSTTMPAHYGYVRRTEGAGGDQVDVYIGEGDPETSPVFVVDQWNPETREFDEHKVVLGAGSRRDAIGLYDAGFSDGSGIYRRAGVQQMTMAEFKAWLRDGDQRQPVQPGSRPRRMANPPSSLVPPRTPGTLGTGRFADTIDNRRPIEAPVGDDVMAEGVETRNDPETGAIPVLSDQSDLTDQTAAEPANATPTPDAPAPVGDGRPSGGDVAPGERPAGEVGAEASPESEFRKWSRTRQEEIAESKAAGNRHLDDVPDAELDVEGLRGKRVYNVHDPKERGVIRTVDNDRFVYVDWSDVYSAEKNLAEAETIRGKTVYRTALMPPPSGDFAMYVLGDPPSARVAPQSLPSEAVENQGQGTPADWWKALTADEREAVAARASVVVEGRAIGARAWGAIKVADRERLVAARDGSEATPQEPPRTVLQGPAAPSAQPELTAAEPATTATVTAANGMKIKVAYRVVDGASLVPASGDLQPRDRTRAASEEQIAQIAGNLDPARLMPSPEADRGAPLIGPDNVVESGNGRVQAILRLARSGNPDDATRYTAYLDALAAAGYADFSGAQIPILVGVRQTDLAPEQRRQWVIAGNQSATMSASGAERAAMDRDLLTPQVLDLLNDGSNLNSSANAAFRRAFLSGLSQSERAAVVDEEGGGFNADGIRRVQGAIIARAYDDPGIIRRIAESADTDQASIFNALLKAAPRWAAMRSRLPDGSPFDITPELVRAVQRVQKIRADGVKLPEALAQLDPFDPISPLQELFMRAMYRPDHRRAAGVDAIDGVLRYYAEQAEQSAEPGGLLPDEPTVQAEDVLEAGLRRREGAAGGPQGGPDFGGQGEGDPRGGDAQGGPVPDSFDEALDQDRASAVVEAAPSFRTTADVSGTFYVARIGSAEGGLAGKNAANDFGLLVAMSMDDDFSSPMGLKGDTVTIYRVTSRAEAGPYRRSNRGARDGSDKIGVEVGRQVTSSGRKPGLWYSFGENADYDAEVVGSISVADLKARLLRADQRSGSPAHEVSWSSEQHAEMRAALAEAIGVPREQWGAYGRDSALMDEALGAAEAIRPTEVTRAQLDGLGALIKSGAALAEIEAHPAVATAVEALKALPETHKMPGYGSEAWFERRVFDFQGESVTGYEAAIVRLYEEAKGLAWTDDKLPVPASPTNYGKRAIIILGPPAAGKSTLANPIARKHGAAIIDADEAKKVLPEYRGGVGANAVHEESSTIAERVLVAAVSEGANVVIPKIGGKAPGIQRLIKQMHDAGYTVDLVNMAVEPDEAMRRMFGRFVSSGRIIPPGYVKDIGNSPSNVYLQVRGEADGNAEIDNNGERGTPKPILDERGDVLDDPIEIESQRGPASGRADVGGVGSPGRARPPVDAGTESGDGRGRPAGGRAAEGQEVRGEEVSPPPTTATPGFGDTNTVFTKDAAERARAEIRAMLRSQLNAGVDPRLFQALVTLGGYHFEAGTRSFARWANGVIVDLGEEYRNVVTPYLRGVYENIRYYPGIETEGMTPLDQMDAAVAALETGDVRAPDGAVDQGGVGEAGGGLAAGEPGRADDPGAVGGAPAEDDGGVEAPVAGGAAGARAGGGSEAGVSPGVEGGAAGSGRSGGGRAGVASERPRDGRPGRHEPAPTSLRPNYWIDDPKRLLGGSAKKRFRKNVEAIEAYRAVTEEGRNPTPAELDAMASYTGWGALGQELFQGSYEQMRPKEGWESEAQWMRDNLSQSEWESAQRSIINAHYTAPPIVSMMWRMAERMGFRGGRVLEPAMGTGNFFGLMPREIMERSELTGIELDELTGGMARLLYPQATIAIKGYEKSQTADDFYDLVIGNWPFAKEGPPDRRYNRLNPSLHDYFFLKALDQVRPGGIVMGVTSRFTMDKQGETTRLALSRKAKLIGAFRLPTDTFKEYAGTAVVTDVLVFQKLQEGEEAPSAPWVNTVEMETPTGTVRINRHFADNPRAVIGEVGLGDHTTIGRRDMVVTPPRNANARIEALDGQVDEGLFQPIERRRVVFRANLTNEREGSVTDSDGELYVVQGERLAPLHEVAKYRVKSERDTATREAQVRGLVGIRRAYFRLIEAERDGVDNVEDLRADLRRQYEAFRAEHGAIVDSKGLAILDKAKDPNAPALAALERADGTPTAIFERSTTRSLARLDNPTVTDAYVLARNETVDIDIDRIAEIAGTTPDAAERELLESGAVLRTPTGGLEAKDVFLHGNVRQKYAAALEARDAGLDMDGTIAAIEPLIPKDVPYFQIEAKMGATWVTPEDYEAFVTDLFDEPSLGDDFHVRLTAGKWRVDFPPGLNNHAAASRFGMGSRRGAPFSRIIEAALNNRTITLKKSVRNENGNSVEVIDTEATELANQRVAELRERFSDWIWGDVDRRIRLERSYNDVMNAVVAGKFDGSFLQFPGMALTKGNGPFQLAEHQQNEIWRGVAIGYGIYGHEVGTGKTYTMGGIAIESRRFGVVRKPLLLAHNANSASVAASIQSQYPGAAILYVDNLSRENRATQLRRIANEDWDLIVVPHSLITNFTLSEATLLDMAREDIVRLEEEARAAASDDDAAFDIIFVDGQVVDDEEIGSLRSTTAKELVRARNRILNNILKQAQRASTEAAIPLEEIGIDLLLVDEAHEFKKPPLVTRMKMKGLNLTPSDRSIALMFMSEFVKRNRNGKGVHLFTGTPITNTLGEIFHMQRYVMDRQMAMDGVRDWDAWFQTFADASDDIELTPTGDFEPVKRLAKFVNVAELRRMMGQGLGIVFARDMPEMKPRRTQSGKTLDDPSLTDAEREELLTGRVPDGERAAGRPYKRTINDIAEATPTQLAILEELRRRGAEFKEARPLERKRMLKRHWSSPVLVESAATAAGLDARLFDIDAADHPNSKAQRVVRNVKKHYDEHPLATQVIFVEQGYVDSAERVIRGPDGWAQAGDDGKGIRARVPAFNLVKEIVENLVSQGVAREQIRVVKGATSKAERKAIAAAMKRAEVRVVIGLTSTLGIGVNMQDNLRAMHHLDAPWMPGLVTQRNGRGERQGNRWNTVLEYRYITEGLDGRRWQVNVVKDRFIKSFLEADETVREIEGDAVSDDEGGDFAETLSVAAGDPRILQVAKLRSDLEKLERRRTTHWVGQREARQRAQEIEQDLPRLRERLAAVESDATAFERSREQPFTVRVGGKSYDKRKDADAAIEKALEALPKDNGWHEIARLFDGSFMLIGRTGALGDEIRAVSRNDNQRAVLPSMQSIEGNLRGLRKWADKIAADIESDERSLVRLREAADIPFAMQETFEKKEQMLRDIERDLQNNPVPSPSWLRQGAPVDSVIYVGGQKRVVTGHRWASDGYFVLTEEGTVPYLDAKDEAGMALFDERPFRAPRGGAAAASPEAPRFTEEGATDEDLARLADDGSPNVRDLSLAGRRPGEWSILSVEQQQEVARVVERVAGIAPGFWMSIDLPVGDAAFSGWGGGEGRQVAGLYEAGDGANDAIIISLMSNTPAARVAYHEAFHRLQTWFLNDGERRTLRTSLDTLRRLVAGDPDRAGDAATMSRREIEAEAFAIYAERMNGESGGRGFPIAVRRAFNRILRLTRAVRNWLAGNGFQTWEDVFDRAMAGEIAQRAPRADAVLGNEPTSFSVSDRYRPKKTVKAYKLFRTDPRRPGELFPLFVDANVPVPIGQWVRATAGAQDPKTGKVKSKLGGLAYRPGWHAGDLPIATHIGGKSSPDAKAPDYRPNNQVWAEVEMAADVDWQAEADARAERAKDGRLIARTAHITDQVPVGGHYRYKTNPNMTGTWLIGGDMRVVRVLEDAEVQRINQAAGVADLPRRPVLGNDANLAPRPRANPTPPESQRPILDALAKGEPLDRAFRAAFSLMPGGLDRTGGIAASRRVADRVGDAIVRGKIDPNSRFGWLAQVVDPVRAGLIDNFGLDASYVRRRRHSKLDEQTILDDIPKLMQTLEAEGMNNPEAARVLHDVLTGQAVAGADVAKVAQPIITAIDAMGQEAVDLGLLSQEAYERNRGAYLHRSYLKHEENKLGLVRWVDRQLASRRRRIVGNQFKGRGVFLEAKAARVLRFTPETEEARRKDARIKTLEQRRRDIRDRLDVVAARREEIQREMAAQFDRRLDVKDAARGPQGGLRPGSFQKGQVREQGVGMGRLRLKMLQADRMAMRLEAQLSEAETALTAAEERIAELAGRKPRLGDKYRILDKRGTDSAGRDRVMHRVVLPAGMPAPGRFDGYQDRGVFEVRAVDKGGKATLWRDWTRPEREQMGEIMDARYNVAKTYMVMAHDLATGRFFRDIAANGEWARDADDQPADGTWKEAADYSRFWADPSVQWVRVPDTTIAGTRGPVGKHVTGKAQEAGTKRYGALAGKYVRAEIWRDLNETEALQRPGFWDAIMRQWKLNKTARSPVVHMNNVMSNLMFMDLAGVRWRDLYRAVQAMVNDDDVYREARTAGAFGGNMVDVEIRQNVLGPVLREWAKEDQGGLFFERNIGRMGKLVDVLLERAQNLDRKMVDAYRMEDEIFRMAVYLRRREQGLTVDEAATEALEQFLNYDINAPWVNQARRTLLPFVSYVYRAVPVISRSIAARPWKMAKYFAVAYALQAMAYALAPSDWDEDEEQRSLREHEQGRTWFGVPRMLRLPGLDPLGNPLFLDIRRWVPAGDIFDTNQGSSAIPIPAPAMPGGPLMLGAEVVLNKQGFTGREITNEFTDTTGEKLSKTAAYLWKAWMPSAVYIPGSWYWGQTWEALTGTRAHPDDITPRNLPATLASSFGVKVRPQDVAENFMFREREYDRIERELKAAMNRIAGDFERGAITERQLDRGIAEIVRKLERLDAKRIHTFTGERIDE